jgi:hypothetical protein
MALTLTFRLLALQVSSKYLNIFTRVLQPMQKAYVVMHMASLSGMAN